MSPPTVDYLTPVDRLQSEASLRPSSMQPAADSREADSPAIFNETIVAVKSTEFCASAASKLPRFA